MTGREIVVPHFCSRYVAELCWLGKPGIIGWYCAWKDSAFALTKAKDIHDMVEDIFMMTQSILDATQ